MQLESGKIANHQLIMLIIGFILGSSIVMVPGSQADHDAWISILFGMGEGILFALIYAILSSRFKGKNLIQINEIVYGPIFSKLISLSFVWFLFHLGSLGVNYFEDFFMTTTLTNTPEAVIAFLMILVCIYAVTKGIEVIARCGFLLVSAAIISFLFSSLLLTNQLDLNNFFPILEAPLKNLLWSAHGAATFPFAETVTFTMIFPCLNGKRNIIKPVIIALVSGGIFLTAVSIRNIGVLGSLSEVFNYPTFQADRLINVGMVITRVEILTVIGFFTMGFVKTSILLYSTVLSGAEIFGLRTYKPFIIPVGILMALFSLLNFRSFSDSLVFSNRIYPIYALPFELGIPLLTLVIALIRGLPKTN